MSNHTSPAGITLAALLAVASPKLFAQAAPAANPGEKDEAVVLSPFVIQASEDPDSYRATSTLAGTRIRTDIKDVGSSISVVTAKFLQDTNSKRAEDLLVYVTNTEVAGQGGNFLGQGDGKFLSVTNQNLPVSSTRVRGLAQADNTRDFFLTDIPFDSYNTGRIDLQRGPNSILFGIGSPAGIINASVNTAAFKDANKVEAQFGSFGSFRLSGDFNKVILDKELAVRVSALRDDLKYKQDPAYKNDRRVYGALRYDPSFLNKNNIHTSFRANYETGKIKSNDPRQSPPLDAITPWFALGRPTYDAATAGDAANVSIGGNPWLDAPGGRVFDGVVTAFNGASQGATNAARIFGFPNTGATIPATTPGAAPNTVIGNNVLRGIATYDIYTRNAGAAMFPFIDIGAYKPKSLTDRSIFDYENHLLDGPNKLNTNDFDALNLAFSQTFFGEKVGYEVGLDQQEATFTNKSFISNDGAEITVDLMKTFIDGTPNPNVGRPMAIAGGGSAGGNWANRKRNTLRATLFGELNFADISGKDSTLAKIFGRNVFTGLLARQKVDEFTRTYNRQYIDDSFGPQAAQGSVGQASRDDIFYVYLGAPITNSNQNLELTGIKNVIVPQTTTTIDYYNTSTNSWSFIPLTLVNNDLASDRQKTYRLANKFKDKIDSRAIVWQGYWFDDIFIPMVGIRRDEETVRSAPNPPAVPANVYSKGGLVNPFDPSWVIPDDAPTVSGTSKTYSIVTHLPKAWRNKLPGRLDLSLIYDKSENFQPNSNRRDILGHPVANPTGKTEEYGFAISALDDKVTLRYMHYKTTVQNATLDSSGIPNQYLIGAVEAWGQQFATQYRNSLPAGGPLTGAASTLYGISSDGHQVTWNPGTQTMGPFNYTRAEIDAAYALEVASINAWFDPKNQVPADFQTAWALTDYATGGGSTNFGASGLVVTGNTVSSGDEVELLANPIAGLNVSINVTKSHASRTSVAQSYVDWITSRAEVFKGPAGDMRLWSGNPDSVNGGETARGKVSRESLAGFNLFRALEGADVPELKPWAFNVVTSYTFQQGVLKGANVGGGYRWIDKSVTGFPVITNSQGVHQFDVSRPYFGKAVDSIDLFVGYQRKLTDRLTWRIQLNVRNAFASHELIPVTVQPDGSPAAFRIPEPRVWTITNTVEF